jgi:NAD(P)-dependent dehydrogenase (short-subunit alcohol dehydrogenase family)
MDRLSGKYAVVTGASTGIGRAVALRFAAEGAHVLAIARSESIEALPRLGEGKIEAGRFDISVPEQAEAVFALCRKVFGRMDVLCNCAGIGGPPKVRVHEVPVENFDRVINTNLRGAFLVLKYGIALMLESGGGSVVNMASIGSFRASYGSSPYLSSKGGMMMLTRAAALDYIKDNIRINAVCPGVTRTEMLDGLDEDYIGVLSARVPMGRMATPEEVASVALFLASDEASHVTGSSYCVDGGRGAA